MKGGHPVYKGQDTKPTPVSFPTTLEDLDAQPNRRLKDEICKRLTPDAQVALMKRYGYEWAPR